WLGTIANRLREKARQMLRDGGIGRVRQAQLLKANTAVARRQFIASNFRKKSFYKDLIEVFARQFRLNGATDEFRPLSQQCDWERLCLGRFEQLLLGHSALMPQSLQLPYIDAIAQRFQALLQKARQRQVHVVATQQDVVADGDAFQRQFATLFGNHNKAEISRATADVAHENEVADFDAVAPGCTPAFQPSLKGRLRFFDQRVMVITA